MGDSSRYASQSSATLCRSIDVWERREDAVLRFRCFELLGGSKYWVQSCDYYRPDDRDKTREMHDRNFLELFQSAPLEEVDLFDSLQEAISHFWASFY